jgi:hypothetical protein
MTHDAISSFIKENLSNNNLGGKVRRAEIPRPDAPADIYTFLEYIDEFSLTAENWRKTRRNLPFVRFFETSTSRLQSIWALFIAIMMKLGLVLVKQRAS